MQQKHLILVISFVIFLVFSLEYVEFNIRQDGLVDTERSMIADGYLNALQERSKIQEKETNRIIKKFISSEKISEEDKNSIQRELCNIDINYGEDRVEISEAYLCVAKLDENAENPMQAIKNASYSIDVLTNDINTDYLANLIMKSDEVEANNILRAHNVTSNNWVGDSSEIEILEDLSLSSNKDLSARAHYRLSLIYSLGKANSNSAKNVNISKAFEHQKAAIEALELKTKKTTNVAFVFNEKYVHYGATTIASILLNSDLDNKYSFHVIYDALEDPITEESRKKLTNLSKLKDFDINFIPFPEKIFEANREVFEHVLEANRKRFPRLVYFKTFLDQMFPNIDQLAVLDVDILVLRDLSDITNIEMGEYFIAAAKEQRAFAYGRLYRKVESDGLPVMYFNAGVMVQNLKLMRKDDFYSKVLAADKLYSIHRYAEQDNLNIASSGRVMFIPSKWNMAAIMNHDLETAYPGSYLPFIIHYIIKPMDKLFIERRKNNQSLPDHIKLYYIYNDFVEGVMAD